LFIKTVPAIRREQKLLIFIFHSSVQSIIRHFFFHLQTKIILLNNKT